MRNSLLIKEFCAENSTGLKFNAEDKTLNLFKVQGVGERSLDTEVES